jgi:hypothetical protein
MQKLALALVFWVLVVGGGTTLLSGTVEETVREQETSCASTDEKTCTTLSDVDRYKTRDTHDVCGGHNLSVDIVNDARCTVTCNRGFSLPLSNACCFAERGIECVAAWARSKRCSAFFLSAHLFWEGFKPHVDGVRFNFLTVHDGCHHCINLTGHAEITFVDGASFADDDYRVTTEWWGGDETARPLMVFVPVALSWPDRPIDRLYFHLSYEEDGVYIRTIERIFYGNWT